MMEVKLIMNNLLLKLLVLSILFFNLSCSFNNNKKLYKENDPIIISDNFINELYTKNHLYEHSNVDTTRFYEFTSEDGYNYYKSEIIKGTPNSSLFFKNSILRIDTLYNSYYEAYYSFKNGFDNKGKCNIVNLTIFHFSNIYLVASFRLLTNCDTIITH